MAHVGALRTVSAMRRSRRARTDHAESALALGNLGAYCVGCPLRRHGPLDDKLETMDADGDGSDGLKMMLKKTYTRLLLECVRCCIKLSMITSGLYCEQVVS